MTNIRGPPLHVYEGRTGFETGRVFGHQSLTNYCPTTRPEPQPAGAAHGLADTGPRPTTRRATSNPT